MGIVLAVLAAVGLLASFTLLHETLEVAKSPTYEPSCNINPLISCSSVMSRPESEVLGLPFAAFGVAAFSALLTFAVLLAAGSKFAPWVWKAALLASLGGMAAIIWMIVLSLVSFGTICPWCFVTWLTTIGIFWTLVSYVGAARPIKLPKSCDASAKLWVKFAPMILAAMFVALLFIIFLRFNEALLG